MQFIINFEYILIKKDCIIEKLYTGIVEAHDFDQFIELFEENINYIINFELNSCVIVFGIFLIDFDCTITHNDTTDELMKIYNQDMLEDYQRKFRT